MKYFKADLHIHSCLSPCGDLDMSPRDIVKRSIQKGLDIIAICDHNSAENVIATIKAASAHDLCVLPGMEICSKEEVHCLAIFETPDKAIELQEIVFSNLKGTNRPEIFGDQVIANEINEIEGFNDRRLIGATELGLDKISTEIHRLGGLFIASHVDRPSFSIMSQLGFIPPDLNLDAIEISPRQNKEDLEKKIPGVKGYPVVTCSDAHFLDDIGKVYTTFFLKEPGFKEICLALTGQSDRKAVIN